MKNVAIIAPAGNIEAPEKLNITQDFLKKFDINTKFIKAVMKISEEWQDVMIFG